MKSIFTTIIGAIVMTAAIFVTPTNAYAENWQRLTSGVTNDFNQVYCANENTCYAAGGAPFIGGQGIVLKTTNGGTNWTSQSIPTTNPIRSIHCANPLVCIAVGDGGGTILKTTNGGSSWTLRTAGTPASRPWFWDVRMIDVNNATAVGNVGEIYRTTNGGTTWTKVSSGTTQNLYGVHFMGAIGWIVGSNTLLKTVNSGLSWLPISASGTNMLWTTTNIENALWIAGDTLRKSVNGGLNLTTMTTDMPVTYRGIAMLSETNGYMVGGGGVIQKTQDGGATWIREESGVTEILRDISCLPSGTCYAVGDDGIILKKSGSSQSSSASPSSGPSGTPPAVDTPRFNISPTVLQTLFIDNISPGLKARIEGKKLASGVKKRKVVSINPSVFSNSKISLNLFDGDTLDINVKNRATKTGGKQIIRGTVTGRPKETSTFVTKGNVTVGNIYTQKGVFTVRPKEGGAHTVEFVDLKSLPLHTHKATPTPRKTTSGTITAQAPTAVAARTAVTVDLSVAYTPQTLDAIGNAEAMDAFIELMVDEANQAYENSDVPIFLRLQNIFPITRRDVEQDTTSDTLETITDSSFIDIRGLSEELGRRNTADIRTLLVDTPDSCGTSWQMDTSNWQYFGDEYSLNVVDIDCVPGYTFIHEVGHNMGLGHDRDNQTSDPLYSYAYGYRDPNQLFRTIMAYGCSDNPADDCFRIPFFSNPDLVYFDRPFGVENSEDNARALRNIRNVVHDFSDLRGTGIRQRVQAGREEGAGANQDTQKPEKNLSNQKVLDKETSKDLKGMGKIERTKKIEKIEKKNVPSIKKNPPPKASPQKPLPTTKNKSDNSSALADIFRTFLNKFFQN